jgi:anaerobic C4-dicarboxylate transporter
MIHPLATQLLIASAMVAANIIVHLLGLSLLLALMRRHGGHLVTKQAAIQQAFILVGVAFGLFALHTIEIWGYAILFYAIGATQTFEAALYYSTATYSTIGYGDVVLDHNWRILGAIEGGNGVILLGWSTAFFVSVVARMRTLEHDWMGSDAIVHPHLTGPSRD